MYKNKTFLAIIPARSGSKGICDKNIKLMNGKPLMAYTIEACKKSEVFDAIIVSTDSSAYAKIAKEQGGEVPSLRPLDLSGDQAATKDVIVHVLKEQENLGKSYDYFMLLQPTSPLRSVQHIIESIDLLLNKKANAVVSLCEVQHPTNLNITLNQNERLDFCFDDFKQIRRQDAKQEWRINGAIYLAKTNYFLEHGSFYKEQCYPYFMDQYASIDIDDTYQFEFAQWLMNKKNTTNIL